MLGVDSDLYRRCTFGPEEAIADVPTVAADIRDVTRAHLEGVDAVLHLAALSNDPLGDLKPDLTYEINHEASVRLASLAREAGVERFVFSSSCSNYGAAGGLDLLTRRPSSNPVTPTGRRRSWSSGTSPSSRTTTSARCTCVTPPPTGSPRGCGSTSS